MGGDQPGSLPGCYQVSSAQFVEARLVPPCAQDSHRCCWVCWHPAPCAGSTAGPMRAEPGMGQSDPVHAVTPMEEFSFRCVTRAGVFLRSPGLVPQTLVKAGTGRTVASWDVHARVQPFHLAPASHPRRAAFGRIWPQDCSSAEELHEGARQV